MNVAVFAGLLAISWQPSAKAAEHSASELLGTWRGSSVCTDRVAAPACRDEVVVYEFSAGVKPGSVLWKADKLVDGKREPMGEFDLAYDERDACWRGEFQSPRVRIVWCVVVKGDTLSGSGWLLPGKQTVRTIDAKRDGAAPAPSPRSPH
jgi:hypothetical protein